MEFVLVLDLGWGGISCSGGLGIFPYTKNNRLFIIKYFFFFKNDFAISILSHIHLFLVNFWREIDWSCHYVSKHFLLCLNSFITTVVMQQSEGKLHPETFKTNRLCKTLKIWSFSYELDIWECGSFYRLLHILAYLFFFSKG